MSTDKLFRKIEELLNEFEDENDNDPKDIIGLSITIDGSKWAWNGEKLVCTRSYE
jgi:chorismate mutase